jgi:hypothetical protein
MIETRARTAGIEATGARGRARSKRLVQLVAATALAVGVLGAGTQTTLAYGSPLSCSSPAQTTVFAPWGDYNTYFRMSNGGFENGNADWSLGGGATVVSGNESYYVGGAGDSYSLRIPPNGSAESRTMCVSVHQDVIRLFVNNQHVSGAILHVDAIAQNPQTGWTATTSFDVNGDVPSSPWAPTMQLKIPNVFGGNGTENLTLRFTLRGAPATWYVDDVFVDPFKSW